MAKDRYSSLGAKLGPRLAKIFADAQVHTERRLLDSKHRLGMHLFEDMSDMIGTEYRAASGDLLEAIAQAHEGEDHHRRVLRLAARGQGQGGAILGSMILGSGTSGALSTIFSNGLYPAVASIVRDNPNLPPGPETLAQLAARGFIDYGHAQNAAEGQGRPPGWFEAEVEATRAWPDLTVVLELWRRGEVDAGEASRLMRHLGIPADVFGPILSLRRQFLAPADAALGKLRGTINDRRAAEAAHVAGLSDEDFQTLVDNTGEPPAVEMLLSLWRRGKISTEKLDHGIRQSRVRNEWIDIVHEMSVIPPSPAEALNAYLEGQISREEAVKRYREGGGDPTWFEHAFNAEGEAPTPNMLSELANRGIIPWEGEGPKVTSFKQGFLEGPWRNKWEPSMRKLAEYLPPPRTITALVGNASLSKKEAYQLFRKQGLTPDLAEAYVKSATTDKTAKQKNLAVTQISALYRDQAIDREQAVKMWGDLGYDQHEAHFLATLTDLERIQRFTETAISTIHSRYTGHAITRHEASGDLDQLGVPAKQRNSLLEMWDLEREAKVKRLTAAEVHKAVHKDLLTEQEGLNRLSQMGYPQRDAEIFLAL
jgi:hypothetical protein